MKYLVLAGDDFYPRGGGDAVYSTENLMTAISEAVACLVPPVNGPDALAGKLDWAEVVDTDTLEIVWSDR